MAIIQAKTLFRTVLKANGYSEIYDEPFNNDNVADTYADKSYNLVLGSVSQGSASAVDLELSVPITLNIYFNGGREVQQTIDDKVIPLCEDLIADLMNVANRSGTVVKNLTLTSFNISPYQIDTNERALRASLDFDVISYLCVD